MLKKSLVGLSVVLVFALASIGFVDFDATELGTSALRQASASTGIRLEASRHRINVVRGLELENIEASARFPGGRYAITMPTMRFQHRVASLLRGRLEIERVVLSEPRIAIVTGLEPVLTTPALPSARHRPPREDTEPSPRESRASPVELRVREVELSGATFSFNDEVSLESVDLSLQSPSLTPGALTLLHAVSATGELSIRALKLRSTSVRNIRASLSLSGGRLDLVDGAFEIESGSFQANVHLDFNTIPLRHRLSLTGRLVGVAGEVSFAGEGFGLDAANLKGEGQWIVPAGRFDDAPLWQSVALAGSEHEAIELSFRVEGGRMVFDGDWLRGSVGLDGELDLIVNGVEVGGSWDGPVRR